MQKYGDILQLSINDGYQNLAYKTLSAYAWIWQTFDTSLNWVIKLDDDLDLKMNKILDRLPLNESQSYPYVHCPCIHHKIDVRISFKIHLYIKFIPPSLYISYQIGKKFLLLKILPNLILIVIIFIITTFQAHRFIEYNRK